MNSFKVKLEDKSNESIFKVDLIYQPIEEKEIDFTFGNSSKSLERNDLEFIDSDFNLVQPVGVMVINPMKREKVKKVISKENPFIYEITGEINYHQDNVHIKLVSAEYLLKKDKKYYMQLRYKGELSEKIEIQF